jgi:hypothetical protein
MTKRYIGLLGAVTETVDLHREGRTWEEAQREQAKRAKRRLMAHRRRKNAAAQSTAESNIIPFRPRP